MSERQPTTYQMRQLVMASMVPAMEYQGMKRGDQAYYVRDSIDTAHLDNDDILTENSHRVGVYLGKIATGFEQSSRRLLHVEAQRFTGPDGTARLVKVVQRFEWNDQGVYVAHRSIRGSGDEQPLFADTRHGESFEDELLVAASEADYQTVTRAECDELIRSTREYYDRVAEIRRNTNA